MRHKDYKSWRITKSPHATHRDHINTCFSHPDAVRTLHDYATKENDPIVEFNRGKGVTTPDCATSQQGRLYRITQYNR